MERLLVKLEHESLREVYFLTISLILAFGILQTTGSALETEKPVVSVVSCSMYPALDVGDVLVVKGQPYENIEVDDIIVYSFKEADIAVNDQEFTIRDYNGDEPLKTSSGDIKLRNILEGSSGNPAAAQIVVDQRRYTMAEGESIQVNGATIEMNEVRGMNIPVVHRVIEKTPTHVETKGDNNQRQLEFEDRIEPDQIHGKMLLKIPRVGAIKLLVMDFVGFSGPQDAPFGFDSFPRCTVKG